MNDTEYMRMALSLAALGRGSTSPNPMVGAVIVKDGTVIGKGWHKKCGEPHAERNALAACLEPPEGATLYVTLEPCCHFGRQPPCTDAILEAGIRRVVVGSGDPNPLVAGKGLQILREHGIEVTEHVLEEECTKLNEIFFHYIQTKRPFVILKYAMTMDGKIAAYTGESRWITGEEARRKVQRDRGNLSAIMVGVGTVLADDPQLTCRIPGGKNPIRVICDSHLRTPLTAQVVATADAVSTILATCESDPERLRPYLEAGCQILTVPETDGHADLRDLMRQLGGMQIDSVLLEGGSTLAWAALSAGIVRKVQAYIAPKIFGGAGAKTPVGGLGVPLPADAFGLQVTGITRYGEDILIESEVRSHDCGNREKAGNERSQMMDTENVSEIGSGVTGDVYGDH